MTIEIKGLEELNEDMSKLSKQIDYASMLTLNDLAFDSQKALNAELKNGLGVRVNTSKAFVVDKAKKTSLVATVKMKRDWHFYALQHHYRGGKGDTIGFEYAMKSRGFMSEGESAIPIKKITKAGYKKIIAETKTKMHSRGYKSDLFIVSSTSKTGRTKHLTPGVYKRLKYKVRPIIIFTKEAQYKKTFDMKTTVGKVVTRRAGKYFFKNLNKAMKTAR